MSVTLFGSVAIGLYKKFSNITPILIALMIFALLYINKTMNAFSPPKVKSVIFTQFAKLEIVRRLIYFLANEVVRIVSLFFAIFTDLILENYASPLSLNMCFIWLSLYCFLFLIGVFKEAKNIYENI